MLTLAAILKSPIAWAVLGAALAWGVHAYQGHQLQQLRTQHAQTLQSIADKARHAAELAKKAEAAAHNATKAHAKRTAEHERQTAAHLESLHAADLRASAARLREQTAFNRFNARAAELAASASTPQQCAATLDEATRMHTELHRSEREAVAAVGKHADELYIRLTSCTAWADSAQSTINAGPNPAPALSE